MKNLISKVPFLGIPDIPIKTTTQELIPIADISDDLIIFKDGACCLVLESSSLNFSLLSEKEQEAVIASYAAMINSFSFPVQITIVSKMKDITKYLKYLDEARSKVAIPKLATFMDSYIKFISETIKKRNVLGKSFYLVIPFTSYELGATKSVIAVTKKKGALPFSKDFVIKKAKIALYPKRDHLIRQGARLGIKLRQLNTAQLLSMVYDLFNSEPPVVKKDQ